MSATSRVLELLASLDRLYESVVLDANSWDESAFAGWLEATIGEGEYLDREATKIVHRAVRRAQRLQRHWADRSEGPDDWRARVDDALGSAGWRPGLELAEWGMAAYPDPALFDELANRFRAVNFTPIALSFESWLERTRDKQR